MYHIPWGPDHPLYFETAEEFFETENRPYEKCAADFDRWSRVPHWTLEEGVALSSGFNPILVNWGALSTYPEHPYAAEYDRRLDLAKRAVVAGQLSLHSAPRQFIKWAKGHGIVFPNGLVQAVKTKSAAKSTKNTTTNPSGLKTLVNKLSQIALGMLDHTCGFNPEQPHEEEYEGIVADLRAVEISVSVESVVRCLKAHDDLYENLPEIRETLGKVVLGIAISQFGHNPKAPRSKATKKIAAALKDAGRPVGVDTISRRLKEAAADLGLD